MKLRNPLPRPLFLLLENYIITSFAHLHTIGIGADILSAAIVWEEQSYANTQGPSFSVHSDIVMPYLVKYGKYHLLHGGPNIAKKEFRVVISHHKKVSSS